MINSRSLLISLVVASPMFLQNIDATAIATALPSMAVSLGVPALSLNLIITSYLLSLAVFLPMSAWLADRFGARQMFATAIGLFTLASALCGLSTSLGALVAFRLLQGISAAMMVPVGRLILLRTIPPEQMISAMVWYTVPAVIGRLAGPLVGGAIVSVVSWRWIFFVNVPFGVVAVLLTLAFVKRAAAEGQPPALDVSGFLLMALGLAATLGALQTLGKGLGSPWEAAIAAAIGLAALGLYGVRSRGQRDPIIDLRILRVATFRTNIVGAVPLRLALAAVPFLLPLMLQLGFGLSPLASGLLSAAAGAGALCTRLMMRWAISSYGFRSLLLAVTVLTGLCFGSYALFSPLTSHTLMFAALFAGGLLSSTCMVALNTLGFVDVPKERMSHATAMTTMAQQLSAGLGVVLAATLLGVMPWLRHGELHQLLWQDFAHSFLVVGAAPFLSLFFFARVKARAGEEWL